MPEPLTKKRIDELRELFERTTHGPFFSEDIGTQDESSWCIKQSETLAAVGNFLCEDDADFWITIHNAFPAILEPLERQQDETE